MQIQKISAEQNSAKKKPSFKSKYILDIGASDPRASLKIRVQDNKGNDLFEYKGFVNDSSDGFKSNGDFTEKVAKSIHVEDLIEKDIKSIHTQLKDPTLTDYARNKLKEKLEQLTLNQDTLAARTPAEKKLTGLSILIPGTLQQHTALFMANVKKTDGSSLEDVNLDDIVYAIKDQGKVKFARTFSLEKDFMPAKDLAGTGIGIAKKIAQNPEYADRFKKGFYGVAVQTGGGFGAVDIKFQDNNTIGIETNESGHDLYFDPKTGTEKRLGKLGASSGSVIENYAEILGIKNPDDIKAILKTGKAELSTQTRVKFDTVKHAGAIQALLKTGVYTVESQNADATTLLVYNTERFEKASTHAIKAYADTIARHAITKINKGANLYVVSGPLAMGLNDRIQEAPKLFGEGVKDLRDLIFKVLDERVGNDFTCNKLREKNHFDVVCNKAMSIENNTQGGALLLANKTRSFIRRGEWITISKEVLQGQTSSILKRAFKAFMMIMKA